MEYITAQYWQQGASETALVLQHLKYPKEKLSMVFACVSKGRAEGKEGCFIGLLQEWFRREGRELFRKDRGETLEQSDKYFRRAFAEMEKQWKRRVGLQTDGIFPVLCGIVCVDNRFLLFQRGENKVYLLNTRFDKSRCQEIGATCGILEPGLGILLATESFGGGVSKQQLCECLSAKELSDENRMQRRLTELGMESARQGAVHQGAILIATK